jgi:hypothetical protein
MKKFIIFVIGLFVGVVLGITLTIKTIQIDGVNELDNGVITIKVFNNYFDYEYEYNEIEKEVTQ